TLLIQMTSPAAPPKNPGNNAPQVYLRAGRDLALICSQLNWTSMGLSCCGRTWGPHGRVSTEVGRPTRLHRGVQAGRRPVTPQGRKDAGGSLARTGHPAQRGAAVEAAL